MFQVCASSRHRAVVHLDADTIVRPDSVDVAALAAGAGIAAVDAALDGIAPRSFLLARPPGHHATPQRGMGFCIFNTVAVARLMLGSAEFPG